MPKSKEELPLGTSMCNQMCNQMCNKICNPIPPQIANPANQRKTWTRDFAGISEDRERYISSNLTSEREASPELEITHPFEPAPSKPYAS